jgi:hypothetical protein
MCNGMLGSPVGAPHIPKVHVHRYDLDGVPVTASFWKPSPDELRDLVSGGCIALHVMGTTHAPISVRTEAAMEHDASIDLKNGGKVDLRAPWPFLDRSRA